MPFQLLETVCTLCNGHKVVEKKPESLTWEQAAEQGRVTDVTCPKCQGTGTYQLEYVPCKIY